MRSLKFRAWDKEDKKYYPLINLWFDSSLGKLCTAELWLSPKATEIADIPEQIELEQYTGFKDKNGKEIYEGDILREKGLLSLTYLEWDKNHARYKTKVLDESKHVSSIFDFDIIDALECEVVGNIHENPELLEQEDAKN